MAVLVAVAGGLIGSIFGVPQLGFLAGSLLGSLLFPNKSPRGGPRLTDLHVTSSTYGSAIQLGFGTVRVGGNIIFAGDLVAHKHNQTPGKGLGGGASYTYSWSGGVAISSTEFTGPITKVLKVWADTKLVYDSTGQSGVTKNIPGNGGGKGGGHHPAGGPVVNGNVVNAYNNLGSFRVYTGTQTQMPDTVAETLFGADNAQAHRGMSYIVMDDIDLENYGNRVPNFTFEVAFNVIETFSQNSFKFDFSTGTLGTPIDDVVAIDTFRQRAYFLTSGGGTDNNHGIYAMSLKDGTLAMQSSYLRTFGAGNTRNPNDAGLIVADDGYLYMWSAEANYGPYMKIDADTLLAVGSIGTANPFSSIGGATTQPEYVVPVRLSHTNALFMAGQTFKDLHLIDVDGLTSISDGVYTDSSMKICGGNQLSDTQAEVFGLGHTNSFGAHPMAPLNVYSMLADGATIGGGGGVITPTLIVSLNPADIDSEWSNFQDASYFVFDATDGNVMFFVASPDTVTTGHHRQYLIKVNTQTGAIVWQTPFEQTPGASENLPGNPDFGSYQTIISTGRFAVVDSNNNVWTFETQGGAPTIDAWVPTTNAAYQGWNDAIGAILMHGTNGTLFNGAWGVLVTNASANSTPLANIVSDVCHIIGLQDADMDVSTLTDPVEGYLISDQMTAKDAISPLGLAFLFDGVESDYILKFVKRGASPLATVPSSKLAYIDTTLNTLIQETRAQEVDLPRQISVNFLDPNHNYQTGTQYARRPSQPFPTMFSSAVSTQNFPLVAEPEFMRQLAEKLLFTSWIERVSFKVRLAWDYMIYDPTDVLTLTNTDGSTVDVRMSTVSVGADLTTEWDALAQNEASYVSSATADGGLGFVQQTLLPTTPTKLFLLDMPLLRDTDDTGQSYTILYEAAGGYGGTWGGTAILKSLDDVNFDPEGSFDSTHAVAWGVCTVALGDTAYPFRVDRVNTLNVMMVEGSDLLASVTLLEACNGANAAAIYNSQTGIIEVIQFLNVTTESDGSFTLSNLLRGRRGTEVYTGAHVQGESFVLLNANTIGSIKMTLGDIGVPRYYRAPAFGTLVEAVDSISFTDTGRTWKPYAPVQITATLSGSDIDLAWLRRTRVGGELRDLTGDVPLSEQSEIYEVDIYNALGDTVLRTLRAEYGATPTTSPGVTYLAADIATDFGSTPATLNVAVYQVSLLVGRGFGKLKNVTVN